MGGEEPDFTRAAATEEVSVLVLGYFRHKGKMPCMPTHLKIHRQPGHGIEKKCFAAKMTCSRMVVCLYCNEQLTFCRGVIVGRSLGVHHACHSTPKVPVHLGPTGSFTALPWGRATPRSDDTTPCLAVVPHQRVRVQTCAVIRHSWASVPSIHLRPAPSIPPVVLRQINSSACFHLRLMTLL